MCTPLTPVLPQEGLIVLDIAILTLQQDVSSEVIM